MTKTGNGWSYTFSNVSFVCVWHFRLINWMKRKISINMFSARPWDVNVNSGVIFICLVAKLRCISRQLRLFRKKIKAQAFRCRTDMAAIKARRALSGAAGSHAFASRSAFRFQGAQKSIRLFSEQPSWRWHRVGLL